MILKNFMEQKQLDYNQPFLSARRFGASPDVEVSKKADNFGTLPFYKSELKSGPIRKAGTVPFRWEKSPGRPKDQKKSQPEESLGRPPIAPKLPPGRIMNAQQQTTNKVNKDQAITRTSTGSPTRKNLSHSEESSKFDYFIKEAEENQSFYSDNGDEIYMDAQDSLSRSESNFLNCSISGVSGLDGLDIKQSGTFSTDPQTRDYMMDRFLPAAKAIASETPQYASRKPPVSSWEHPGQPKYAATVDKKPPVYHSKPNFVPYYAQYSAEEESEYEDSEYGDQENMSSGRVCGLLPRFCLKNSFFVMNPVPGMRVGSNVPASSVRTVRAKSSYPGAHVQTKTENHQKTGLSSNLKAVSNSNPTSYQISSKNPDGSSLYKRLQAGGTSPYRHGVSQSPSHEDKNGRNSFEELLDSHESTNLEPGSESPMVEKTLYIDSVHILASAISDSDTKGLSDTRETDSDFPVKSWGGMKEFTPVEDIKDFSFLHGSKLSDNSKMDWENHWPTKPGNGKDPTSQFPLPPPLPKSPTESWLGRTLPSVSSRNQSSRSFLSMHARETNVKTSNMHLQLSKDLLTPIPES